MRHGLALREYVVIAAFSMILLMILIMWLGRTRGDSRRIQCERRQQQTASAIMQYEALHGHYCGYKNSQAVNALGQRKPTGWVFGLLPLMGYDLSNSSEGDEDLRQIATDPNLVRPYQGLFEDYGPEGDDETRGDVPRQRIGEIICPEDPAAGESSGDNPLSWIVNTGMPDAEEFGELPADWTANGIFENQFDEAAALQPRISTAWLLAHDGLESTLMLSENVDAGEWTDTEEALVGFVWVAETVDGLPAAGERLLRINAERGRGDGGSRFARPGSFHAGGANAVFASGKTQFLNDKIDWLVFARLMSSDGENAKLPGTETPVPEAYR